MTNSYPTLQDHPAYLYVNLFTLHSFTAFFQHWNAVEGVSTRTGQRERMNTYSLTRSHFLIRSNALA
eukprot:m.373315 g.373315  ORF g.373315 m.373315 type:complete len:67 (-) comp67912_c0_seq1:50-250(-)